MESKTPNFKIRLGLFIAGGIALFLIALFIIGKQKNLFDPVFNLTSNFRNVSGLEVGSNIRFSGITVGTVDNIKLINDSTVQVDLLIKKSVHPFIKVDCQATISSAGIIGERILVVTQGSSDSPIVKSGQHIESIEPVEPDAIIGSLQITANKAEIISDQLALIMTKVNGGRGTLGRIINDEAIAQDLSESTVNLKKSTKQISEILVDINNGRGILGKVIGDTTISNDLAEIMVNLKYGSQGLDEILEAAKHNFLFRGYFNKKERGDITNTEREIYHATERRSQQGSDTDLVDDLQQFTTASPIEVDSLMKSLQVSAANSEIITKQLADIMLMINSGKGTLGMLVQDTVLANVINQTIVNMKSSSKGLDENMNAAKENFLFRGYFERKKKEAAKKKKEGSDN